MEVTVYGPLRGATGEKTVSIDFEGDTVAEAIEAFVEAYPRARRELYDGDELRPSVRAVVDGETAEFDDPCSSGASLALHPAVRGG